MDAASKMTPTTKLVKGNGMTFPLLTWGPEGGRVIFLLHGFPQEPGTWDPVAHALAQKGFQVFAPFQRGYAPSTRPEDPREYTFHEFVQDVLSLADALRIRKFDVAGFGVGGAQAWMLAAYHSDRIRSLTSIRFPHPAAFAHGVQSNPEQQAKWQQLQQALGAGDPAGRASAMLADDAARLRQFLLSSGLPQPYLDRYVERLKEPGALIGALNWEHAISLEEFSKVPVVSVPTLLIWSEGPALSRTSVDSTRRYVSARFTDVAVPRAGNFILETTPEALLEPILQQMHST